MKKKVLFVFLLCFCLLPIIVKADYGDLYSEVAGSYSVKFGNLEKKTILCAYSFYSQMNRTFKAPQLFETFILYDNSTKKYEISSHYLKSKVLSADTEEYFRYTMPQQETLVFGMDKTSPVDKNHKNDMAYYIKMYGQSNEMIMEASNCPVLHVTSNYSGDEGVIFLDPNGKARICFDEGDINGELCACRQNFPNWAWDTNSITDSNYINPYYNIFSVFDTSLSDYYDDIIGEYDERHMTVDSCRGFRKIDSDKKAKEIKDFLYHNMFGNADTTTTTTVVPEYFFSQKVFTSKKNNFDNKIKAIADACKIIDSENAAKYDEKAEELFADVEEFFKDIEAGDIAKKVGGEKISKTGCDIINKTGFGEYVDIFFKIIRIGAPILCVIMIMKDIFTAIVSSSSENMKKAQNNAIKRVIVTIVLFLLPTVVILIFNLLGYSNATCHLK